MAHSHAHRHAHGHAHGHHHGSDNLRLAFWLNLGFALVELIGGLLTNSMAILADALHDLGDSIAIGLAWRMAVRSRRTPGIGARLLLECEHNKNKRQVAGLRHAALRHRHCICSLP